MWEKIKFFPNFVLTSGLFTGIIISVTLWGVDMVLALKQIFDVVGESQSIDYPLVISDCEIGGLPVFEKPIPVKGRVYNRAGIVMLEVSCEVTMHLCCDRCLTVFDRSQTLPVSHILVTELHSDADTDDEYVVVEEDMTLDLDELLRADILLSLPSKILCKEDCKGLCSVCGGNRNEKECHCEEKSIDPRLQILGDLLK